MSWKQDYYEAGQYNKAVQGMVKNGKVDNETLYHIICLAVEKYTGTLSGMLNYIPMHSGLSFVFRELNKKLELPSHFLDEVKYLNGFMVYCSLDFVKPKSVSEQDISRMVIFLNELAAFSKNQFEQHESVAKAI